MSDTAQAWVWQHSRTRGTARLVLLALAREAAEDGTVRMGVTALARLANATRGAVGDGIAQAVTLGELEIREPGIGKRAALYALPQTVSYPPVSVPDSRTQDPASVRKSRTLDTPDTPLRPGIRDASRSRPEIPDAKETFSVRESGPLQLDLTDHAENATRAQASSKAVTSLLDRGLAGAPAREDGITPAHTEVTGRPGDGIPDFARPLVDTLTASGVVLRWDLSTAEWLTLHAMLKRSGLDMLAAEGARIAARTPIRYARYLLRVWRDLPPAPAPGTAPVQPAPGGATVLPLDPNQPRRTRAQRTADELALILAREAAQQ